MVKELEGTSAEVHSSNKSIAVELHWGHNSVSSLTCTVTRRRAETLLKRAERSSGELSVPYCDNRNRTHWFDSVVGCTFHRRLGTWLHFEDLNKLLIHP